MAAGSEKVLSAFLKDDLSGLVEICGFNFQSKMNELNDDPHCSKFRNNKKSTVRLSILDFSLRANEIFLNFFLDSVDKKLAWQFLFFFAKFFCGIFCRHRRV